MGPLSAPLDTSGNAFGCAHQVRLSWGRATDSDGQLFALKAHCEIHHCAEAAQALMAR